MSKIEKALKKARDARGEMKGAMVRTGDGGNVVRPASVSTALSNAEPPARASESAMIPFMHQPRSLTTVERSRLKIITPQTAEDAVVKSLRHIRTKIAQKTEGRNCVLMVTGIALGSGATFLSTNLAAAFALDKAKTALLIDCNLRDPALHGLVLDTATRGLVDFLTDNHCDVAEIIKPTGIERLRVIPAGKGIDSSAEYFTMDKMRRLVRAVHERYPDRQIVIDAPPLTRSADTHILMELCDFVVVAVPYGKVTQPQLQAALKMVDSRKLLGVMFNSDPHVPPLSWSEIFSDFMSGWFPWRRRSAQGSG